MVFPPGSSLAPGGVIVIANQAANFLLEFGVNPDFELVESDPGVPNMVKYLAWAAGSITLANTGDEILILDGNDTLLDAVSWGTSVWAFDPAVPGVAAGHSIERFPAAQDSNSALDWRDQPVPSPGNPPVGAKLKANPRLIHRGFEGITASPVKRIGLPTGG